MKKLFIFFVSCALTVVCMAAENKSTTYVVGSGSPVSYRPLNKGVSVPAAPITTPQELAKASTADKFVSEMDSNEESSSDIERWQQCHINQECRLFHSCSNPRSPGPGLCKCMKCPVTPKPS
jgi:hypothetical protein